MASEHGDLSALSTSGRASASSSSAGCGHMRETDASVRTTATDSIPLEVSVVGHRRYACLDKVGENQFVLTHIMTREKKVLPPGEWELHYEPEHDFGAVVGITTEGAPVNYDLDELFTKQVLQTSSGDFLIRSQVVGGEAPRHTKTGGYPRPHIVSGSSASG